jgi:hypothetical protein
MSQDKYIWENDQFRKDPFAVPEGYFAGFPDRMMERIHEADLVVEPARVRILRPWMAWVSGIAAVLVIGWFGIRTFYQKPLQEVTIQENIALFVDFYGEELHEGELAGFIEDHEIDLKKQSDVEVNDLIQMEPDLAEEYIFESIGF